MIGSEFQQQIIAIDDPRWLKFKARQDEAYEAFLNREPEIYDVEQGGVDFNENEIEMTACDVDKVQAQAKSVNLYLTAAVIPSTNLVEDVIKATEPLVVAGSNETKEQPLESDVGSQVVMALTTNSFMPDPTTQAQNLVTPTTAEELQAQDSNIKAVVSVPLNSVQVSVPVDFKKLLKWGFIGFAVYILIKK